MLAIWYTGLIYLALIVLVALLVIAMVVGYELLRRDFKRLARANDPADSRERAQLIQEQLLDLKHQVQSASQTGQKELARLWRKTDEALVERLGRTSEMVAQVRQGLGAINEASQRISQLGAQLTELNQALRVPPGGLGAGPLFLADLLARMLPPQHYQLNATLGDGRCVDAAVALGGLLLGIDASFAPAADAPTDPNGDALSRAARAHVDRIAAECIRPDRGTVDFALMYLPDETLYYELVIRDGSRGESFSNYALARRVIPVSPNTLFAYLHTIVLGLRGLRVEHHAHRLVERVAQVHDHLGQLQQAFSTLGLHLGHATGKYDQVGRQIQRLTDEMADLRAEPAEAADASLSSPGQPPLPTGPSVPFAAMPPASPPTPALVATEPAAGPDAPKPTAVPEGPPDGPSAASSVLWPAEPAASSSPPPDPAPVAKPPTDSGDARPRRGRRRKR